MGADDVGLDEQSGPTIERSTCDSAAKCTTVSTRCSRSVVSTSALVADVALDECQIPAAPSSDGRLMRLPA